MARKKKQSTYEDLIDIVAMLPWWVGVVLAVLAYFILHHYAAATVAPATGVANLGANASAQIFKMIATLGQYILPLGFLIGAGMSAYGRTKRTNLLADVGNSASVSALNGMSWQEFEMLVGEAFRRTGYKVSESGGGGADGGVDIVLKKDNEIFLVQCKQWKALKVGVSTVRELYGVMAAEGAVGGFVVTSGTFTQEAKTFANGRNIDLIDGSDLKKIISEVQQPNVTQPVNKFISSAVVAQHCPKCGGAMIKRIAKQGANAGNSFWGCSNYPQCRGVISIE